MKITSNPEAWPKELTVTYTFDLGGVRVTQYSIREFREEAQRAIAEVARKFFVVNGVEESGSYSYRGVKWSAEYGIEDDERVASDADIVGYPIKRDGD